MIQKALEELCFGRTTIVVAHRLSTIKNADEIIVLTGEGIQEKGDHDSLIAKNGLYKELYQSQFKIYQKKIKRYIDCIIKIYKI